MHDFRGNSIFLFYYYTSRLASPPSVKVLETHNVSVDLLACHRTVLRSTPHALVLRLEPTD